MRRLALSRERIDPIVPSDQDAMLARTAQIVLEQTEPLETFLQVQINISGCELTTLDLPPIVTRLLMDVLRETAAGKAVSLVSVDAEITTQEAASILNVSRPYVIGMVDKGLLPMRMVGNQRRLPLRDVLAHKAENRATRHKALDDMAAIDQELGLI
jgi:excisionase family DNA binding protein